MKARWSRSAWVLLLLLGVATSALSACPGFEPNWLVNYEGQIDGRYRVRMTLTSRDGELVGVYFYASQLADIRLRGRVLDGTQLLLDELDADGKVTAQFEARFVPTDPKGRYRSNDLQCEVIVGTWRKVDSKKALPVYLSMADGTSGTLEHRYTLLGVEDDEVVHANARRFVEAVRKRDRATVAALIVYPINVAFRKAPVRSAEELIAHYDSIFTPKFRAAILGDLPRNMFIRYTGISLGNSGVWFNEAGKVFAL